MSLVRALEVQHLARCKRHASRDNDGGRRISPIQRKASPQGDQLGSLRPFDMSMQQRFERLGKERFEERHAGVRPRNKCGDWLRYFRRKTLRAAAQILRARFQTDIGEHRTTRTVQRRAPPAPSRVRHNLTFPSCPRFSQPTLQGTGHPSPTGSPPLSSPCAREPPGPSQWSLLYSVVLQPTHQSVRHKPELEGSRWATGGRSHLVTVLPGKVGATGDLA